MRLVVTLLLVVFVVKASAFTYCRLPTDTSKVSILFVGNSLTYANDLPALVSKIAKADGYKVKTEMLALADYALADHLNDGKLQKLIASEKFDFIVVQQGPSSQEEGRTMLMESGEQISKLCKEHNSRLAFYMVWPSLTYANTFDGVIRNYTEAAERFDAVLCRVGAAWKSHIKKTGDYSYYAIDRFHPSKKGSEVAALIIWKSLRTDWRKQKNVTEK